MYNIDEFEIVRTKDKYFRFVNHNYKLLTMGFDTQEILIKAKYMFRFDIQTIEIMKNRYDIEYILKD